MHDFLMHRRALLAGAAVTAMPLAAAAQSVGDGNKQTVADAPGKVTRRGHSDRQCRAEVRRNSFWARLRLSLGLVSQIDVQRALSRQFAFPSVHIGESGFDPQVYTAYNPGGAARKPSGSARRSGSALVQRQAGQACVLSARAGEGATSVAANLAVAFAQLGERTLLVDANFRDPNRHCELFGLSGRSVLGLSNVLSGRCSMKQALIAANPFSTLQLLSAGAPPPNPQELLSHGSFAHLIESAPKAFDAIIIDGPPVLDYPDAQMLAARAESVLFVTRRNRSRVDDLVRAKTRVAVGGTRVLGAVMCD